MYFVKFILYIYMYVLFKRIRSFNVKLTDYIYIKHLFLKYRDSFD